MLQKSTLFLGALACLLACAPTRKTKTPPNDLATLEWLQGNWNRVNTRPGQTATESWEKVSATEWKGVGTSFRNGVKSFEEQLKLVQSADGLYYEALVPENNGWVRFKVLDKSARHFICENPAHDFPKKIAYTLQDDGKMNVVISGDGKSQQFVFESVK
jgi:hypothetical protein